MSKKDSEPNQNLSKLISQVRVLSKTVDELEKEIKDLKSKSCNKNNKKPTTSPIESKKAVKAPAKTSPFRLKFFRKIDKTKENGTPNESSKKIEPMKEDDSTDDAIPSNTPRNLMRQSSEKRYTYDSNEIEKTKRKSDFTQTSNPSTQIIKPKTQRQVQAKYSKSDTCCCNSRESKSNNQKKAKTEKDKTKPKRKMCSDDCPYLPKHSYTDNVENTSRKPFKNKKLMVNLIGSNRNLKNQMRKNKNFVLDCKFLQNADFAKLMSSKGEKQGKRKKLFSDDGCESRNLPKECKQCSKNRRTKNVLKIKKAILTQKPPMIFVSPDLERGKIRCAKRKDRKKREVCLEDCCPSLEGGRAESSESESFDCPCSAFAASIGARCNKLCQTESPRK